jgi:hypothetical protein
MSNYDSYINTIDVIEDSIDDNSKFPVVKDNKIKQICRVILEFLKITINYLKYHINATQKSKTKDE